MREVELKFFKATKKKLCEIAQKVNLHFIENLVWKVSSDPLLQSLVATCESIVLYSVDKVKKERFLCVVDRLVPVAPCRSMQVQLMLFIERRMERELMQLYRAFQ